jgi:hypothetical protein
MDTDKRFKVKGFKGSEVQKFWDLFDWFYSFHWPNLLP